jgi:hypothetical protein
VPELSFLNTRIEERGGASAEGGGMATRLIVGLGGGVGKTGALRDMGMQRVGEEGRGGYW